MENQDVRWKQRFQNFEKAFVFFEEIVNKGTYSLIDITALVKAFEFTFELGWKTIKDYLYEQGIETAFPRAALKEGFATGIIKDGHVWMEMLEKRNEPSHTYNQEVAKFAVEIIRHKYYIAIGQVYNFLRSKINQ
ncbi:MAG: nucleotidyltransferase substrate binding protein [Chitinophagaceae bacterium]|nr:nucleotidyltransferase substrate binding protein [Chitinophagaceae bacterium]